jgi:hypothetical protein
MTIIFLVYGTVGSFEMVFFSSESFLIVANIIY